MIRELLPWEKKIIGKLGANNPEKARRLLRYLTKETSIVEGRLITRPTITEGE